jgi:Protein  of unknown function (DUF3018)
MLHVTKQSSKAMAESTKDRVNKHRAQLRKAGLKPIQIWVPDPSRRGFAAECRRQALRVNGGADEKRVMREIEALMDTDEWT